MLAAEGVDAVVPSAPLHSTVTLHDTPASVWLEVTAEAKDSLDDLLAVAARELPFSRIVSEGDINEYDHAYMEWEAGSLTYGYSDVMEDFRVPQSAPAYVWHGTRTEQVADGERSRELWKLDDEEASPQEVAAVLLRAEQTGDEGAAVSHILERLMADPRVSEALLRHEDSVLRTLASEWVSTASATSTTSH
ncbi:hypothetical protein FQ330_03250 [Agrococcus sediminis]|uniref:Uncharacterized protein n=1 Tax=Agrococcus sediminis TaxID=2599924 RepID=A0A5M8QK11_9MICO|nr:hypothetical protein [Agrococcus sediminis]KAA6436435.1 hypothetical protein FQ330_03250 [Agrococcus sediminis]